MPHVEARLDVERSVGLDGPFNVSELEGALRSLKADKSPGGDGLLAEFYKSF